MKKRWVACLPWVTCLLFLATGAWAQDDERGGSAPKRIGGLRAHVAIDGGVGCVDREALSAAIRARLTQSSLVAATHAEVLVKVRIEPAPSLASPFLAHIRVQTPAGRELGQRELEAPEPGCESLESALVLVLALAIESPALREAVAEEPGQMLPPEFAAPATAEPPVAPTRPGTPSPPSAPTPKPRAELELGGHLTALMAALPRPGVGVGPYLKLTFPRVWPLRTELSAYLPQSAEDEDAPPPEPRPGATVFWADFTVLTCPSIASHGRWSVDLCGGGLAGLLASRGRNLDRARDVRAVDVALAGRLLLTRELGSLLVGAGAGGAVWLRRHDLVYDDRTGRPIVLYERPPGCASLLLTFGYRSP